MPGPGPQRSFFDLWSWVYDVPFVQRAMYYPVHDGVLRRLRTARCRTVLDLGCGTGQLTARIARELPGVTVVGCDFSAGMLERGAARAAAIAWVRGDAARLPFADACFDAVTSTEAFHWFPDQRRALAECFRVMRPGGRLLVALVNTPHRVVSQLFGAGSRLGGQPYYWPTAPEMRTLVERAGFRVEDQERIHRPFSLLLPPVLTVAVRPRRHRVAGATPSRLSALQAALKPGTARDLCRPPSFGAHCCHRSPRGTGRHGPCFVWPSHRGNACVAHEEGTVNGTGEA